MSLIELKEISKIYLKGKNNSTRALDGVNLSIDKGEFIAVVGKSGSGKSTLLHILGLADTYTTGNYILDGKSLDKVGSGKLAKIRNDKIGFVLQDFALINQMTVFDNIATPLYINGVSEKKIKAQVLEVASELGINDILNKKANQISGGQCQRVAIARAIINKPEIILADEPTGALDSGTAFEVVDILKKINANGTTVIVVTHDMDVANRCNKIITIKDGKIEES